MDDLLVEMLQEDEAGGGADDGGQASDGRRVGYAQRKALAHHLVMLGPVLPAQFLGPGIGGPGWGLSLPKEQGSES